MKDVMVDIETLGTTKNSVIVQIGACYFDRKTGEIGKTFSINIEADSSFRHGFEATGSTIYWWLQQEKEARESLLTDRVDVVEAIKSLNDFLKKAKKVWSHATFDFVILMNHFEVLNIKPEFHYRSARDLRTLVDLANWNHWDYERVGTHHNGLDDCIYQVRYTVDCLNSLSS